MLSDADDIFDLEPFEGEVCEINKYFLKEQPSLGKVSPLTGIREGAFVHLLVLQKWI